jgi:DNA-binding MarR family transcriptional regulator
MPDLSYVIHDLVLTMDAQGEAKLAPFDLSMRKFIALTVISENPGVTSRRLASVLHVTEAGASGIVKQLITAGLIQDSSTPGSGRAKALTVTGVGAELLPRATSALGESFDDVVRAAGEDPEDLKRRLQRVVGHMQRT